MSSHAEVRTRTRRAEERPMAMPPDRSVAQVRLDANGNLADPPETNQSASEFVSLGYVGRRVTPVLDQLNVLARQEPHILNRVKRDVDEALWGWGLGHLPPGAIAVLEFVRGRTFRYGKYAERIPEAAFLDGVANGETGEVITSGLDLSLPTLRKHLRVLRDAMFIERWEIYRPGRPNYAYSVAPGELLFERIVDLGGTLPELSMPRNLFLCNELLIYIGPNHWLSNRRLERGSAVRFKGSDRHWHVVRCVNREGHDIGGPRSFHIVPRQHLRRMTPDEKAKAFRSRLCGDLELVDEVDFAQRHIGPDDSDLESYRLPLPGVPEELPAIPMA